MANYFSVKTGKFYLKSKTPQDGYVEVTTLNGQKTYHKEFSKVVGELVGVRRSDNEFEGKIISSINISLKNGDDYNVVSIPLLTTKNTLHGYAQSLAKLISALELGKDTELGINNSKKDEKGYLYKTLYFSQDGENIKWTVSKEDMPEAVKTVDKLTKRDKWDYSDQEAYLLSIIEDNLPRLEGQKMSPKGGNSSVVAPPSVDNSKASVNKKEDPFDRFSTEIDSDLPF